MLHFRNNLPLIQTNRKWVYILQANEEKKGIFARLAAAPLWKKLLIILGILLAAVLVVGGLVAGRLYSQVSDVFDPGEAGSLEQVQDEDIAANGERFYNLLLLGLDYDEEDDGRDYAKGKGMTDVIMYVQIDRDTGKVNILQIPRDSYMGAYIDEAAGCMSTTGKINEAFANGPDQENLINNIANKVYDMFKLPVDNFVTIDMQAFTTMLNVMGCRCAFGDGSAGMDE